MAFTISPSMIPAVSAIASAISTAIAFFEGTIMIPIVMAIVFWMSFYYVISWFVTVANDNLGIFSAPVWRVS